VGNYLISIHGLDSNTAWTVGNATILHTRDGGLSWYDQTTDEMPFSDINGVFAVDADQAWIARDSDSIFLTTVELLLSSPIVVEKTARKSHR
jgi:photosystem II stability/assembly factor-like uncharacterized protein